MAETFSNEDLTDLRGEHVCCDYTCTFDGTMRRAAAEIERLRAALRKIATDDYTREDENARWPEPTMIWQSVAKTALNIHHRGEP